MDYLYVHVMNIIPNHSTIPGQQQNTKNRRTTNKFHTLDKDETHQLVVTLMTGVHTSESRGGYTMEAILLSVFLTGISKVLLVFFSISWWLFLRSPPDIFKMHENAKVTIGMTSNLHFYSILVLYMSETFSHSKSSNQHSWKFPGFPAMFHQ